jgi:hypothetical protein
MDDGCRAKRRFSALCFSRPPTPPSCCSSPPPRRSLALCSLKQRPPLLPPPFNPIWVAPGSAEAWRQAACKYHRAGRDHSTLFGPLPASSCSHSHPRAPPPRNLLFGTPNPDLLRKKRTCTNPCWSACAPSRVLRCVGTLVFFYSVVVTESGVSSRSLVLDHSLLLAFANFLA